MYPIINLLKLLHERVMHKLEAVKKGERTANVTYKHKNLVSNLIMF